jgi:hypothetical protein
LAAKGAEFTVTMAFQYAKLFSSLNYYLNFAIAATSHSCREIKAGVSFIGNAANIKAGNDSQSVSYPASLMIF